MQFYFLYSNRISTLKHRNNVHYIYRRMNLRQSLVCDGGTYLALSSPSLIGQAKWRIERQNRFKLI